MGLVKDTIAVVFTSKYCSNNNGSGRSRIKNDNTNGSELQKLLEF